MLDVDFNLTRLATNWNSNGIFIYLWDICQFPVTLGSTSNTVSFKVIERFLPQDTPYATQENIDLTLIDSRR